MENEVKFQSTFEYKLIYVFRINDRAHEGVLKIGDATLKTDKEFSCFKPKCEELNAAADKRIREYTLTAGIHYDLLYTEIAVYLNQDGVLKAFRDHKVHDVLKRSGIKNVYFDITHKQNEWFKCDLETAKNAIKAVKEGRTALEGYQISENQSPIVLRPEQEDAVRQTIKQFGINHHMLWNAKMRFGKTLSALELVKRMRFKKTIIITHRPDVDKGWFDDFLKIFYEQDTEYSYGSKQNGKKLAELLASNKPFIYFASIQDLRGSEKVGGKFDKNDEVFKTQWDLVVTDEAHEGTQTELGKKVRELLIKDDTYDLSLSGTPFNLFDQYASENTFTWDYIMEQKAKYDWRRDLNRFGDSNPYEELPKLNIFTYQLDKLIKTDFDLEDKAFNFKEFFRVWTGNKDKDNAKSLEDVHIGKFVHEDAVKTFLDLLATKSEITNYPFSTEEYREYFRHTLWMIPGVKEAKALTELLKTHPVFGQFSIVNVAGDGDYDYKEEQKARDKLSKAMTNHPENTRTITLSCGRLTTGVTIPEWTGVLMLCGSYMTDAKQYLQTIFRVQSPGNINGKIKENCYVFDFSPDRTLRVVYDSVQKMSKMRKPKVEVAKLMGQFLNFCPVIALNDVSCMKTISANELLQEVKRVYAERVVESGFDDRCLYDELKLKQLDKNALDKFEKLREIVGKTKQTKNTNVIVNENDLTDEQREELKELEKEKKKQKKLSKEDEKRLTELKKLQDKKRTAISILRAISIRIPLLVYGMNIDYSADVTIDDFANLIDEASWKEFMPEGVTQDLFKEFIEYYDKDIFIKACRNIRTFAKQCDYLKPTERIKKLAELFAKFKNPDKETVLTPWRVVNLHMSQTIGGYCFFDDSFEKELDKPVFKQITCITENIFTDNGKVLEINSKTGLYPLYVAYTFFRNKVKDKEEILSLDDNKKIWNDIIENNIYVMCKTDMARSITKRTLLGYQNEKFNAQAFNDLINQMKENQDQLVKKILKPSFWDKGGDVMRFNAVVGNPPYQEVRATHEAKSNGQDRTSSIFPWFQLCAEKVTSGFTSLIYPGVRWIHQSGKGMKQFGKDQMNDVRMSKLIFYPNSQDIFKEVAIADGISIVMKEISKRTNYFEYVYVSNGEAISVNVECPGDELMPLNPQNESIVHKSSNFVNKNGLSYIHDRVLSQKLFEIESNFVEENPTIVKEFKDGMEIDYDKEVKLFTNDKAGKSGRSKWYVTSRNSIKVNQNLIDEWQVVVSSANAGGQKRDNQIEIIDNHSAFGRSRVALGTFKTEEEAKNFFAYMNTDLVKFMFLMTDEALTSLGKKVPDLMDYTSNNKFVNFSKDLNDQVNKLFDLTFDEATYIKNVITNIRKKK